jgi:hypothetical protein
MMSVGRSILKIAFSIIFLMNVSSVEHIIIVNNQVGLGHFTAAINFKEH